MSVWYSGGDTPLVATVGTASPGGAVPTPDPALLARLDALEANVTNLNLRLATVEALYASKSWCSATFPTVTLPPTQSSWTLSNGGVSSTFATSSDIYSKVLQYKRATFSSRTGISLVDVVTLALPSGQEFPLPTDHRLKLYQPLLEMPAYATDAELAAAIQAFGTSAALNAAITAAMSNYYTRTQSDAAYLRVTSTHKVSGQWDHVVVANGEMSALLYVEAGLHRLYLPRGELGDSSKALTQYLDNRYLRADDTEIPRVLWANSQEFYLVGPTGEPHIVLTKTGTSSALTAATNPLGASVTSLQGSIAVIYEKMKNYVRTNKYSCFLFPQADDKIALTWYDTAGGGAFKGHCWLNTDGRYAYSNTYTTPLSTAISYNAPLNF